MAFTFSENNPIEQDQTGATSFPSPNYLFEWNNTTAGSTLIVILWASSTADFTAISDSAGNDWTIIGPITGLFSGWSGWIFYAPNPSAYSGNDYMSLTWTGGSAYFIGMTFEILGAPAIPTVIHGGGGGSSSVPTFNLTDVVEGSVIFGLTINTSSVGPGLGSGYSGVETYIAIPGTTRGYWLEYNLDSDAGTVPVDWTGSTTWGAIGFAIAPPTIPFTSNGEVTVSSLYIGGSLPLDVVARFYANGTLQMQSLTIE